MIALVVANAVGAAASVAFAVVAAIRPALLSHSRSPTTGERFYGLMYAARAIPLGCVAGLLPLAWSGPVCGVVLVAAAIAQVGDAGIGVSRREWRMTVGSTVLAAIHVVTAIAVW